MARWLTPPRTGAALATLAIAAIWLATWYRSQHEVDLAIAATQKSNSNLAIAYEENAADALGDIDEALRRIGEAIRDKGLWSAVEAAGALSYDSGFVRGFAIVRDDGEKLFATGQVPAGFDRRDDFIAHRERNSRALRIAAPERSPTDGAWRVPVSRRIDKPDGSFGGLVVAALDPARFTDFYGKADLGALGVVTLVHPDGLALARRTGGVSTFGADMRGSTLSARQAQSRSGSFLGQGKQDGVRRLYSYRAMARYPLVVMVGIPEAQALADAHERVRLYILLAALSSCMVLLVATGTVRFLARQKRSIEELTAARARLGASEARARAITENMAGGVVTSGRDGIIIDVNSAAADMHGYAPGEMIGMHLSRLVHASDQQRLGAVLEALAARPCGFKDAGTEFLAVRKDGTPFDAEVLISSLEIDGRCTYIGIEHDISERKRMERDAREREARLSATFNQALVGIAHTDLSGRFLRVNPHLCALLGYTEAELLALGSEQITHPDDREAHRARFAPLLANATQPFANQATKRFIRKDGITMWALSSVSLIRDHEGQPAYFLAMIQDITELKRAEQMKTEFVSTVSHELRTPLTSIRGSLGLLAGGVAGTLPDKVRPLVAIARNNCERLIRLVNDILDIERIDAGRMRFEQRRMALRPLVDRAVESMDGFAREHGVPLQVLVLSDPPACEVDGERFIQMLGNLVSNAVKFSPPGSPVVIALSRTPSGRARIEVRDRGPGIPREFHARIFQRFSQADASASGKKEGSGLGLSIAKGIAERMGGSIGFDSPPGQGATFFVELPALAAVDAATPSPAATQEA